MKAKTLTTAIAFTGLLGLGGTTFAADAHEGYQRAFPGDGGASYSTEQVETMGKAAYGTPTESTSTWSSHDPYHQAFPGDGGTSYSQPDTASGTAAMGKAAYGSSSSSDAPDAYRNAFHGD